MDIGGLDLRATASVGAEMVLRHPGTGDDLGVRLKVQGYDSEAVEAAAREVSREAMKAKTREDPDVLIRRRRVAQARASLMGVEGATGETTTVDQYRELMGQPGFIWIIEQIEAFAGDRASFFKSAGTP